MSANVFANGLEVSAKKSSNKSIAAKPDVCLSPPSPPAGPVPIPYPNFSNAGDTTSGTRSVKLQGAEAGIKNESTYSTSKGDEAATRALGMGTVTHTIQGKTKFAMWSMNVKYEGSNVQRFTDLTTHNHANPANSASTTSSVAGAGAGTPGELTCAQLEERNNSDNSRLKSSAPQFAGDGNTNTNFQFKSSTPDVPSMSSKSHSKVAVQKLYPSEYVEGNPAAERLKSANPEGESNIHCDGTTFRYSAEFFKGGHTEARIVETIFGGNAPATVSGTLKMKIDWQPTGGGQSSAPCEYCQAILCAAKKCGLTIVLCSDDNREVPMEDEDCQEDLDMRKPGVRGPMIKKNNKLADRLKSAEA
jgi:hypothetical protein